MKDFASLFIPLFSAPSVFLSFMDIPINIQTATVSHILHTHSHASFTSSLVKMWLPFSTYLYYGIRRKGYLQRLSVFATHTKTFLVKATSDILVQATIISGPEMCISFLSGLHAFIFAFF